MFQPRCTYLDKTFTFRDLLTGVKIDVIRGWSPYSSDEYVVISSINNVFKSYGVALFEENINKGVKRFLTKITRTLQSVDLRSDPSIRIEDMRNRMLIGERKDQLPGGETLITRFKAKRAHNNTIIRFWQYIDEDNSFPQPSVFERIVDNIGIGTSIPFYKAIIRERKGTQVFTVLVPRYWMYNGFVNTDGELEFKLWDRKGVFALTIQSTAKYFYIDDESITDDTARLLTTYGYQYAPYTGAIDYALKILGTNPQYIIDISPPQLLLPYIREILIAKPTGLQGNLESKILIAENKALWITTYGYQPLSSSEIPPFFWNAHVAMVSGSRNPELLRNILLSIVSHIQLSRAGTKRKIHKINSNAGVTIIPVILGETVSLSP